MKVSIASDHAGFKLKKIVLKNLITDGYDVLDRGTYVEVSCDYPDFAEKAAYDVVDGISDFAILICGTGLGMNYAANKIPGIRAAQCCDLYSARLSREHNNANVLTFGARIVGDGLAIEIVNTFLKSKFQGGRHQVRIDKITSIENKYINFKRV